MIKLDRILLPTDFSDCSRKAAEYACELARLFDAQIQLLHVIESPPVALPSPGAPLPLPPRADLERDAEQRLQEWLAPEVEQAAKVTRVFQHGTPFVEIVRHAKENEIDLIVLGTHGRSGLAHALIGSVAERVVRKAPCPVLTVQPDKHQFVMP